jgi:hypothetical protein
MYTANRVLAMIPAYAPYIIPVAKNKKTFPNATYPVDKK